MSTTDWKNQKKKCPTRDIRPFLKKKKTRVLEKRRIKRQKYLLNSTPRDLTAREFATLLAHRVPRAPRSHLSPALHAVIYRGHDQTRPRLDPRRGRVRLRHARHSLFERRFTLRVVRNTGGRIFVSTVPANSQRSHVLGLKCPS